MSSNQLSWAIKHCRPKDKFLNHLPDSDCQECALLPKADWEFMVDIFQPKLMGLLMLAVVQNSGNGDQSLGVSSHSQELQQLAKAKGQPSQHASPWNVAPHWGNARSPTPCHFCPTHGSATMSFTLSLCPMAVIFHFSLLIFSPF